MKPKVSDMTDPDMDQKIEALMMEIEMLTAELNELKRKRDNV